MSMREATRSALLGTAQQLLAAYQKAGFPRTERDIWPKLGATPMIGQNDVPEEVFTPDDAKWLVAFASTMHLGRLSFWSANRDAGCGGTVNDKRISNTCSGVGQGPYEFTHIFADGAARNVDDGVGMDSQLNPVSPQTNTRAENLSHDDSRTSPYPIWRANKAYQEGAKVVWQDRVYQAKWYSQGSQPDAPVKNAWDTPWRYLGPVLSTDREAVRQILVAGTTGLATWESERVYIAGDQVQSVGKAYRAKWWTQGDRPQEDPDRPFDHPWEYLGDVVRPTPAAPSPTATPTPSRQNAPPAPVMIQPTAVATPTLAPGSPTVLPLSVATPVRQPMIIVPATTPIATVATPTASFTYTVRPNDTISSIAAQFSVPVADVVAANRLTNPAQLAIGQQLVIPNIRR